MIIRHVAMVCHEANRAYCESIGDRSQRRWDEAEAWQRESAIKGVEFALENPNAPASAQHESWLAAKVQDGWKYGTVKDAVKKEHPCMIPYNKLPPEQRLKDHLFREIVRAFAEAEA